MGPPSAASSKQIKRDSWAHQVIVIDEVLIWSDTDIAASVFASHS